MYLAIFGSTVVLTAVVGAAAAAALIYEYYAFKQRERDSSMGHRIYSSTETEPFERNSLNRTDLRRRKCRSDLNQGSSSHIKTEVIERASNDNSENLLNSKLYVLEVAEHSSRDGKLLDDVIRNSECNEKFYEKNVFNKVKNDLSSLNQNFEEKVISEKNIHDSSCVNYEYNAAKTFNSSVKYKPLVTKVGENSQNHSNCEGDTFHKSLDNLNNIATCSKGLDDCEIHQIGIAKPNCPEKIAVNSKNHNQSPKNIIDNDREAQICIGIHKEAYINSGHKFEKQLNHDNPKYLFHSAYENEFKKDCANEYDRQEIIYNCKGSNWEETILNNSICENLHSSSTMENKLFADQNSSVKHKFNYSIKKTALVGYDGDILYNKFEKQKENICSNKAQKMKLNIDSYACSPCARQRDCPENHKLQPSVSLLTVGLNDQKHQSSLQPGVELKKNRYHSGLQPSSSAFNNESCTKVSNRHALYNQYKKRILCDNNTKCTGETKKLNDDASAAESVSSKRAMKSTLNFNIHPQLSLNAVSNFETSKFIDHMDFHLSKKINLGDVKSNHVENILTSSIDTVNQLPALSSVEDLKHSIYSKTAENTFYSSGKERGNGTADYQAVTQSEIRFDHASTIFLSYLCHKFMPELQSYVSSIRNFVKEHKKTLLLKTNNPNSENTASSSIEHDIGITEAEDVDISSQISSECDTESEKRNNHISKPQHMLCKGCMEVLANTISVPCGHSYFCMHCAEITSKFYNKCCICHNHVISFQFMTI